MAAHVAVHIFHPFQQNNHATSIYSCVRCYKNQIVSMNHTNSLFLMLQVGIDKSLLAVRTNTKHISIHGQKTDWVIMEIEHGSSTKKAEGSDKERRRRRRGRRRRTRGIESGERCGASGALRYTPEPTVHSFATPIRGPCASRARLRGNKFSSRFSWSGPGSLFALG